MMVSSRKLFLTWIAHIRVIGSQVSRFRRLVFASCMNTPFVCLGGENLFTRAATVMAVMAAMGCSRTAMPGAAASVIHSSSITLEAGLSLGLPQKRCKLGLGLHSTSSGCRATGKTLSRLQIHAGTKLGDMGMGTVPAKEAKEVEMPEDSSGFFEKAFLTAAIALMPLVDVETASAAGGELGLLEGRSFALLHPIAMGGLFVYTLYAGYLGWQWRRVRTIQNDITELKRQVKQVPVAAGDKSAPPPPPSPVEAQITSLTEERKELVKGGFRDRHFNAGSILLGFGVFEAVGGCLNTWFRTGKLFPGPHLFAGAGITILWALAASLVPAMQKGNETARSLHIGLNVLNVALFIWQIPTGWEIVEKVFQFTSFP